MSEVGTISKSMSPKMLGALAPGCEAKILGDNGEILGKDEVGEILAKTPTIMKGEMEFKVILFTFAFYTANIFTVLLQPKGFVCRTVLLYDDHSYKL